MDRLGVASHVSNSRKLIVRTKAQVKIGMQVYDEGLKTVGRIFDVFGPIKNPYVSIVSTTNGLESYIGHLLYTLGKEERKRN